MNVNLLRIKIARSGKHGIHNNNNDNNNNSNNDNNNNSNKTEKGRRKKAIDIRMTPESVLVLFCFERERKVISCRVPKTEKAREPTVVTIVW